ncbi:nucleoside triphosphate pyrophosphohydrolase [Haloarcula litorea]|uniref:nucleoside triphosphate pyrophosphohydrolase n=1 Tax=Haloarcula litorea TaxID=3032579 RepID=UPI0023E76BC2|nr:nucleoside triphosphate pyrophosphohydrolase [Halomicroarcula sp. GDY20]
MPREYDKLVRDRIPEVIEADGETPVCHEVAGEAYDERLAAKLVEEAAEYRESRATEALADVLEVVDAIRDARNIGDGELQAIRERKADERGRFEDGVALERVEE